MSHILYKNPGDSSYNLIPVYWLYITQCPVTTFAIATLSSNLGFPYGKRKQKRFLVENAKELTEEPVG